MGKKGLNLLYIPITEPTVINHEELLFCAANLRKLMNWK